MRSLFSIVVSAAILAFALPGLVSAQDSAEVQKLRTFLRVPPTSKIVPTEAGLAAGGPIKVFITTDSDPTIKAAVMELIQKANEKAVAPNRIDVVATSAQADVVLVQFENFEKRHLEQQTALATSTRAGSGLGTPTERSEALGWVLVKTPTGYGVLEQFRRSIEVGAKRRELRGAFEKVLKKSGRL